MSSMFAFFCPRCGQRLKVPDTWAGDLCRCAQCRSTIRAPIAGAAADARTAIPDEQHPDGPSDDPEVTETEIRSLALAEAESRTGGGEDVWADPVDVTRCPSCGFLKPRKDKCPECGHSSTS